MHRHRSSCALLLLLVATPSVCADVTYSYVADKASYTGAVGSIVSVNLYLVESVSQTGANQTSLINRYFSTADLSVTYTGLASVGVGVSQTGLSSDGTTSQIRGPSVFTPENIGLSGVSNNLGFTFGPAFTYNFTQRVGSTNVAMVGGSGASRLFQNLNDPLTGYNGNNLQVQAALSTASSLLKYNSQNGAVTDGVYDLNNDVYASGKILIGTLGITVGQGTTTFQVKPLAQTKLTNNSTATFNTISLSGITAPGTVSSVSGGTTQTMLSVAAFGSTVYLDQSYATDTMTHSDTYNSYNSINSTVALAGPSAKPTGSSTLPFYSASGNAFAFTVAAVPEPSSLALCGVLAIAGAASVVRRHTNHLHMTVRGKKSA